MTGTVYLSPGNKGIPADLRKFIDPSTEIVAVQDPRQWPLGVSRCYQFDYYLTRTRSTRATELAAQSCGAVVAYLPVMAPALADEINKEVTAGRDIWLYQPEKQGDRP